MKLTRIIAAGLLEPRTDDEIKAAIDAILSLGELMTLGEDRVRIKFNPQGGELVAQIKAKVAELIDLCEAHKAEGGTEAVRHWSLAQTCFEDGSHWAVKAATTGHA